MLKPGYRTSEFWFTLVSFLFSGLYLVGLLDSNDHKEDLIQETTRGVEAVILIIGQLTVLFRYIKGRTEIKKVWCSTTTPQDKKEATAPKTRRKKDESHRSVKTKSRKTNTRN